MLKVLVVCLAACAASVTGQLCYGDVTKVDTTGASAATAKQDKLTYTGVKASHTLASNDLKRMAQYKTKIKNVASKLCVDSAVIAAIVSRESRAGAVLKNGWGDGGNAFGLMQVDKRYHNPVGTWDSQTHIEQATGIVINMIKAIQKKFPKWTKNQQLKGGISAYNAGPGNVQTYDKMDVGTTGNDYANDVVARAQYYKKNGY